MLRGEKVLLRARQDEDIPILHTQLYNDVPTHSRADSRPWRPVPVSASVYRTTEPSDSSAYFSVVDLADNRLAGEALLWGIDLHNRLAHVGIALLPSYRGRGLAADTVRVLCHYGFVVRGLHRIQIETLAENTAMISTARRAGFTLEGTLRRSAWVYGSFVDEVILGRLADEA
jgi:RimJ/RimL family protein N-acetyltransferase